MKLLFCALLLLLLLLLLLFSLQNKLMSGTKIIVFSAKVISTENTDEQNSISFRLEINSIRRVKCFDRFQDSKVVVDKLGRVPTNYLMRGISMNGVMLGNNVTYNLYYIL